MCIYIYLHMYVCHTRMYIYVHTYVYIATLAILNIRGIIIFSVLAFVPG